MCILEYYNSKPLYAKGLGNVGPHEPKILIGSV